MRLGESDEVREMFDEMGIEIKVVDASKRFFDCLDGVTDPEEKRKAIGETFIRVFEQEQKEVWCEVPRSGDHSTGLDRIRRW